MRNRRDRFSLHIPPQSAIIGVSSLALALIIYFVPPTHILIIFAACLFGAGIVYGLARAFFSRKIAYLVAISLGMAAFLSISGLLDIVNGIIFLCFITSLSILMHQK